MKIFKRTVSLILIICTLVNLLNIVAFADNTPDETPSVDVQTGMSLLYDYMDFDSGKAGITYVNEYTGQLHHRRSDISLGGERLPVSIEFFYDPINLEDMAAEATAPYGDGWLTNYNRLITFDGNSNRYAYRNENGTWIYFVSSGTTEGDEEIWNEDIEYGIGDNGLSLRRTVGSQATEYANITIIDNDTQLVFDTLGRLWKVIDGTNQITVTYISDTSLYQIQEISDPVGRRYCFSYNTAGQLETIACKKQDGTDITVSGTPISMSYSYQNGKMVSASESGSDAVNYTYDNSGRLVSASNIDKCGHSISYVGNTNEVSTVTEKAAMGTQAEASGYVTTFTRTGDTISITRGAFCQEITFDDCGQATAITVTLNDEPDELILSDLTIQYGFVEQTDGSLLYEVTGVTSNLPGDDEPEPSQGPEEEEDPEKDETEEDPYDSIDVTDSYGNIISSQTVVDNLSQTTTYTYSSDGNYLLSETDADNHTIGYHYDTTSGILESLVDGNGNATEYTYNAVRELTNVNLDVTGLVDGSSMSASYSYDKGRLIGITYGDYDYDFSYDIWGNVLSVTMNDQPLVSYSYGDHAYDHQASVMTYGNGNAVYYTYGPLGNVETVAYGSANNVRFSYGYDDDGSMTSITDHLTDQVTEYSDNGFSVMNGDGSTLYSIQYDDENAGYIETINGTQYNVSVTNGETNAKQISLSNNANIRYASKYDALNRITEKTTGTINSEIPAVLQKYSYSPGNDGSGNLVAKYEVYFPSGQAKKTELTFNYLYDENGNIIRIQQSETTNPAYSVIDDPTPPFVPMSVIKPPTANSIISTVHYSYDEAGQLKSVTDDSSNTAYRYSYDSSGNLQSMNTYSVSGGIETLRSSKTLNYTNGILTGYSDGTNQFTYTTDTMGNPVSIQQGESTIATLTWDEGRALTSYATDQFEADYTYNADGLRIEKSVTTGNTTKTTKYLWSDNGLAGMIDGSNTITILYDYDGEAAGFTLNGQPYTYIKNLQGDVLRILDASYTTVASYTYDPWGVPTPSGNINLAKLNPCTYRGYLYDWETGYYYLQSRYYDPEIGRFLCADEIDYLNVSENVISDNIFAYCNNAPVSAYDPNGHMAIAVAGATIAISASLVLVICGVVLLVFTIVYRKQIARMISSLLSRLRSLASALSVVVAKALTMSKLSRNVRHHIVAKAARLAAPARYYLTSQAHGRLSINSPLNLILLNERFHRHLHTKAYYTAVNAMLISGYTRQGVIASLCIIRTVLWAVNKKFF